MKLRSYTRYKTGRMEWLGEIPDHWALGRVKNGFDLQLGKMLQPKQEDPSEIEVSYLRAYNVGWERVHMDDIATMWANPKEVSQFAVVPGDLLVCEGGEAGRAAIMPDLAGPMEPVA
jgi:type I restriction enzyme S subunit